MAEGELGWQNRLRWRLRRASYESDSGFRRASMVISARLRFAKGPDDKAPVAAGAQIRIGRLFGKVYRRVGSLRERGRFEHARVSRSPVRPSTRVGTRQATSRPAWDPSSPHPDWACGRPACPACSRASAIKP